jgi:replicative DNA helicase
MMSSPRAVVAATDRGLRPHHFYSPSHGLIFDAILKLDATGAAADSVTVSRVLKEEGQLERVGGIAQLSTLTQMCPAVTNAGHYAQIVLDAATERNLHRAAIQMQELAAGEGSAAEKIAEAERIVSEAVMVQGGDFALLGDQMGQAMLDVEEAYRTGKERQGLQTGFIGFDRLTNGLKAGQLCVVAARPGMGKSLFGQNVAEWVAGKGQKVCIFSLEMATDEIGLRMVSSQSRVPHEKIERGALSAHEWGKVQEAHRRISALPIYTVDGTTNVTELRARARRLQRSDGLDLLIVDYLQLLAGGNTRAAQESRQVEVSDISRSLKLLARELRIPVIALAQLSRGVELRTNKRPTLSDLRDSGAIEQDADVVAFIYRDEYYDPDSPDKGVAEIIVSKQRAGATGTSKLRAVLEQCRFANEAREPSPVREKVPEPPGAEPVAEAELTAADIPF